MALLAGLLLLPLMISNESLWLDECGTAAYGLEPSLSAWWQHLTHDIGADCQMPLSLFFSWLVSHFFGSHEWQLRAINIAWGALALIGMYRAGKRLQLPWLPLLLAIQPYFWFYTNEVRPFALEVACGAWLFSGLAEFIVSEGAGNLWAWEFSIATVTLCLTTMLAPLFIGVTIAAGGIVAFRNKWKIHWKSVSILLGAAVTLIPVAIYYFSTLGRGVQGAQIWHVDLKFFAYVLYELTGMVGLGPSIESIRELAHSPHLFAEIGRRGYQFLLPAAGFIVLFFVLIFGLRKYSGKSKGPVLIGIAFVLLSSSLIFLVVGICIQKAFWARHFAPIVPFYVALLGVAISGLQKRTSKPALLSILFIGLLFLSSLDLRFGPQHRKENYRGAAEIARVALAEKKSVWWAAGFFGAKYYNLDCTITSPEAGKVFLPTWSDVTRLPPPDLIILSKPDIFDPVGDVQNLIRQNGYRQVQTLTSFTIWTKQP